MTRKKFKHIVGVDEAGRGALCGPVVAGCVCFQERPPSGIKDSKQLRPKKREYLFYKILSSSFYSFGLVGKDRIDEINIFWATQAAFVKAMDRFLKVTGFKKKDTLFIIDGPHFKYSDYNTKCVIAADETIKVVSAASILAKVLRDKIMRGYDRIFAGWNFARHKGYATQEHRLLIRKQGISPIHRLSFKLAASK
ncbi:MAG: ribonuclease HII [Candidatus Omnitrophica bacterium]|nr:ribonuclease HII [Candidatus Omnitrophota bacterium]